MKSNDDAWDFYLNSLERKAALEEAAIELSKETVGISLRASSHFKAYLEFEKPVKFSENIIEIINDGKRTTKDKILDVNLYSHQY